MPNTSTMYQQQQAVAINSPVNPDPQQRMSMGYVPPPPPPPPPPPQGNQSGSMQGQVQMQQYTSPGIPGPPKSTPYAGTSVPTSPPPPPPPQTQVSKAPRSDSARKIGLDHFNFLAVLGKGNFGKVMLAETKATKQLYAIKVLKKEFIIENDEVESIRSEKRVFLIANKERHPFLLNLHACFQTETRVYFVMEYISGGDLMLHIQRGQFGTKRAQFYAAEVCLALKYFHENGVIYRDLKLDNILLTLDGHIKIGDYGLCKEEMWYGSTTSTFCGTPEFMAPEILLDKRYGRAVDWWAFGVLIYQMLLQQSPFRGEDEDEIYDAILSDEPLYPIHMPRDSVSILQKLLTREPELRLGSGPTDAQEIMSHAFFRNVNWDDIYHKRVPSPFLPQISSPTDTSNFDQEFTSVTPVLTPVQSVLTQAMQEEFRGFSYTADFV
ncbi:Phototropin-2 [Orbilia brochopaga]|nr:Phototropin-2 [Drechslerella brochopaga]